MTKEELANKLEAYGITGLAEEVRNSEVSIDDSAHFTVFDREVEEERGEEGYGTRYSIATEERDGVVCTAVYAKLTEPEGRTVWEYGDADYYEVPEGVYEFYGTDDYDDVDAPELSDAVDADREFEMGSIEDFDEDENDVDIDCDGADPD